MVYGFFSVASGSLPAPPAAGDPGRSLPGNKESNAFFGVSCQDDTSETHHILCEHRYNIHGMRSRRRRMRSVCDANKAKPPK